MDFVRARLQLDDAFQDFATAWTRWDIDEIDDVVDDIEDIVVELQRHISQWHRGKAELR